MKLGTELAAVFMYSGTGATDETMEPAPSSESATETKLPFLPSLNGEEAEGVRLPALSAEAASCATRPVDVELLRPKLDVDVDFFSGELAGDASAAAPVNSRSAALRLSSMAILLRTEGTSTAAPRRLCVECERDSARSSPASSTTEDILSDRCTDILPSVCIGID